MPGTRWRGALLLCLVPALLAGCLTMDEPEPTTSPPPPPSAAPSASTSSAPSVIPSEPPRRQDELIIALPELPDRLLPPAADLGDSVAHDLVHRSLYRLDADLTPVPDLARGLPTLSEDGLTWTVDLALDGARFASGRPVTAEDVAGSLSLARSPTCKLDTDVCNAAGASLDSAEASEDGSQVVLHLEARSAPLLAEVLARLPILDTVGVEAAAAGIVTRAGDLEPTAPDELVTSIFRAISADECITAEPPDGCRPADHEQELEAMLTGAGVALPRQAPFTDSTGQLDRAAYADALLARVAALGQVLTQTGRDRRAAALGLVDGFAPAFGAGPYRVVSVVPGERMVLEPIPGQSEMPGIPRIVLEVVADPSIAATRLQGGDVDWLPRTDLDLASAINGSGRPARAGLRPLDASWVVVFNTRRGRPYSDALTRAAFASCVDRAALTERVGAGDGIVADTPLAAGSWAMESGRGGGRDVDRAAQLLDLAGWSVGDDGIRVRDDQRLSTSVALRTSQVRLLAMMQAVAGQLRECGIELAIEDLDVTGDRLLQQSEWPNDFDTLLTLRGLGVDPDADLEAFESRNATTADKPSGSNPGGFESESMDRRIARARRTLDQEERTQEYGEVQDLMATEVPAWWVWYESGWSAIADRVRGPDGEPIDPTRPRYEHDIRSWTLLPHVRETPRASAAPASPEPSAAPADESGIPSGSPSPAP